MDQMDLFLCREDRERAKVRFFGNDKMQINLIYKNKNGNGV